MWGLLLKHREHRAAAEDSGQRWLGGSQGNPLLPWTGGARGAGKSPAVLPAPASGFGGGKGKPNERLAGGLGDPSQPGVACDSGSPNTFYHGALPVIRWREGPFWFQSEKTSSLTPPRINQMPKGPLGSPLGASEAHPWFAGEAREGTRLSPGQPPL